MEKVAEIPYRVARLQEVRQLFCDVCEAAGIDAGRFNGLFNQMLAAARAADEGNTGAEIRFEGLISSPILLPAPGAAELIRNTWGGKNELANAAEDATMTPRIGVDVTVLNRLQAQGAELIKTVDGRASVAVRVSLTELLGLFRGGEKLGSADILAAHRNLSGAIRDIQNPHAQAVRTTLQELGLFDVVRQ